MIENLIAAGILIVFIGGYVLLRRFHHRQIQEWISLGLITRKPMEFRRRSQYRR